VTLLCGTPVKPSAMTMTGPHASTLASVGRLRRQQGRGKRARRASGDSSRKNSLYRSPLTLSQGWLTAPARHHQYPGLSREPAWTVVTRPVHAPDATPTVHRVSFHSTRYGITMLTQRPSGPTNADETAALREEAPSC